MNTAVDGTGRSPTLVRRHYMNLMGTMNPICENGQLIHDDVSLKRQTGAGRREGPDPRPIKLQGHHNSVQFRNVWIQVLDLDNPPSAAR